MSSSLPQVFISYSWDNIEHKDLIKTFSDKLKSNNINTVLDKDIPLTPDEGWIQWMKAQITESDYVILVFTKIYYERFTKKVEPTEGQGVQWESRIIFSDIYNGANISKYIPVVLNDDDLKTYIPNEIDCSRFNIQTQFDELCNSIKDDWEAKSILNKRKKSHSFISEYFHQQNLSKEDLIKSCTKYLEKIYVDILIRYKTIDDIINHISSYNLFPCIVKDLYYNYNEEIQTWLDSKDFTSCKEVENIDNTPRIVIIFNSKHNSKEYNVTFISKNIPNISNSKSDENYDLNCSKSKNKLIEKIMSYVQRSNPKVDLILPHELFSEDINLWEVDFKSLSRLSRLNIRDLTRYNMNDEMKIEIKKQWNIILSKIADNQTLHCIESENCIRDTGNNMPVSGISSKYLLKEKHFKYLLETDISYIMLWTTREYEKDITTLYSEGITGLQEKYFSLNNDPINLMWDDPTTYYYPDEIQGESNE